MLVSDLADAGLDVVHCGMQPMEVLNAATFVEYICKNSHYCSDVVFDAAMSSLMAEAHAMRLSCHEPKDEVIERNDEDKVRVLLPLQYFNCPTCCSPRNLPRLLPSASCCASPFR